MVKFGIVPLKFVLGLLIFILFIHVLATINFWYWIYNWLDMPMHFLAGCWLAMLYFYLIQKLNIKHEKFIIDFVLALGFVALIGVSWEFFEFSRDYLISAKGINLAQTGLSDTMGDLFFDLFGGVASISVFYIVQKLKNSYAPH